MILRNLPELASLSGLRNLRTVQHLQLTQLPKLATVDGLDNLRTIPGTLQLHLLPLVPNLQGLGQLLTIGTLTVTTLPLVATFTGLHQATIGGLVVADMPALTSLAGPTFGPTFGSLGLARNPVLANLGGLSSVTAIDGSLHLEDNPAVSLSSLASLLTVGGNVRITGSTLTSVASLGIQRIDGDLDVFPSALPQMSSFVLPALTFIGERLNRIDEGPSCGRTGAPLLVRLPALLRIEWKIGAGVANAVPLACQIDLELPALTFHGAAVDLSSDGLRDVTLGPVTTDVIKAFQSQTLRSLRFTGQFNIGAFMAIEDNPLLQTLQGTGQVGGRLSVTGNASLSQAAAEAWAAGVSVGGNKIIVGNKNP